MGWVLFAITDFAQLGQYVAHMFSGRFWDTATSYLVTSNACLWLLALVGSTTLPLRLGKKLLDKASPAVATALRTIWVMLMLLLSMAFLVGDSYNPFLYFRF